MYKIYFTKQALNDLEKLKSAGLSGKDKVLLDVVRKNPYQIPPRYEKLVGKLDGLYSRRINLQHRIVYQTYEEPFTKDGVEYQGSVKIIRMWTHYEGI